MFINLFDSHTHSNNSSDGSHPMTFICEKAVESGLSGICITDHCELREYEAGNYERRITQSVFEAGRCRNIFNGRISVMAGIEMSDILYDPALTDRVQAAFAFDMVMVSQHNSMDGEDLYLVDFPSLGSDIIDKYMTDYFTYMLNAVKTGKFDTIGHLTYPVRYITGIHKIPVDLSRYDDMIEEILRVVASLGKAIEINASGLSGPLGDTMPSFRYIKRYRELGGEHITLGSDAHVAEKLGTGIPATMQMLLDAGFTHFTFFKERNPIQLKIL